jgi:L-threonylcarbamoyladenylate synthase
MTNYTHEESFQKALQLLRMGHPVGIPTETVYGLGAPIDNPKAIERVFSLKERPFFDPLIVHIAKKEDIRRISEYHSDVLSTLIEAFWPGPLTIVLPKKPDIHPMICSGLPTIGIRFPSHPVCNRLISELGVPLAAPSANKFGKTSPTKASHVLEAWPNGEVHVIDGGSSDIGIESSVIQIDLEDNREVIKIIRKGIISLEMLERVTGNSTKIYYAESNATPGHTPDHYMPEIPLCIIDEESIPPDKETVKKITSHFSLKKGATYGILTLEADPLIAARMLYDSLHAFSKSEYDFILVERNKKHIQHDYSHWDAIWDRLEKAASMDLSKHIR